MTYDTLERRTARRNANGATRKQALNFERYAAEGERFINEVAAELNIPRNTAARITRAVLHALRDRMPADNAVQFAQGLPMALKGVYFDQYDISDAPVKIRSAEDFLDYVEEKNLLNADYDFGRVGSTAEAVRGVFRVLEDYMDPNQTEDVKHVVGRDIRQLLE